MLHPSKMASSYDCDGCGHHACFHRMEAAREDKEAEREMTGVATESRKRRRIEGLEREEEEREEEREEEVVTGGRRKKGNGRG